MLPPLPPLVLGEDLYLFYSRRERTCIRKTILRKLYFLFFIRSQPNPLFDRPDIARLVTTTAPPSPSIHEARTHTEAGSQKQSCAFAYRKHVSKGGKSPSIGLKATGRTPGPPVLLHPAAARAGFAT